MKNRIIWIFEPNAENAPSQEGEAAFAAFPWMLFGNLNQSQREEMERIYEAAWAKTKAQNALIVSLENSGPDNGAEIERFQRLLGDWEADEFYGNE